MAMSRYQKRETSSLWTKAHRFTRLHPWDRLGVRLNKIRLCPWKKTEAAELLEFALLLPILLVIVAGIMDFATAYNIKQKLANAAREGARMATSQPTADLDNPACGSVPCSIQAVKDDVTTYLKQAGVDTSFIGTTATYSASAPYTAQYYTSSKGTSYGLKIVRYDLVDVSGTYIPETHVTLTYPYDWTFGFDHIIRLLIPSATGIAQIGIETESTMADLS